MDWTGEGALLLTVFISLCFDVMWLSLRLLIINC